MAIVAASPSVLGATPMNPALEAEIGKIDAVTADPDRKMVALEAMAVRLG